MFTPQIDNIIDHLQSNPELVDLEIYNKLKAILRMVTGIDYIGIVPDYIFPRYCHGHFPKDDKIIDFMQLGFEENKTIIANTYWYPLEKREYDRTNRTTLREKPYPHN